SGNAIAIGTGATVSDSELDELNGGEGDYSGASVTVMRNGGAVTTDVFDFDISDALFEISGGDLQYGGQTFASFTSINGVLTISFSSAATAATTALVNDVLQHITY